MTAVWYKPGSRLFPVRHPRQNASSFGTGKGAYGTEYHKRVFGLVKDFGTSQSPKSTRPLTTY
ncbi:hypothetical protein, partial [Thiolapillus sp.]|uniref:hypothetical protein n=1 Tax=Thiolapillus sp. TaxID=2017437 RepID=UPI0025EB26A8